MVSDNELHDIIKSSAFHIGLEQSEQKKLGIVSRIVNFIRNIFR